MRGGKEIVGGGVECDGGGAPGEIMRARRRELGLTIEAVASAVGIGKGYLSMMENGHRAVRGARLLTGIERALSLPRGALAWAVSWDQTPDVVRRRIASLEERCGVHPVLAQEPDRPSTEVLVYESMRALGRIERVRAMRRHAVPGDRVRIPGLEDPGAIAVRISGDSMMPRYGEGDVVVFGSAAAETGELDGLAWLRGRSEAVFSRVYFERDGGGRGVVRLQPANLAYPPLVASRRSLVALLPAVAHIRTCR